MVDPPAARQPTPVQPRATDAGSPWSSSTTPCPTLREASPSSPSRPMGIRPSTPPRCTPSSWWKETAPRITLPKRMLASRTLSPSGIQRPPHSAADTSARPSEAPAQARAPHQPRSMPLVASIRSRRSEIRGERPPSSTTSRSTSNATSRLELSPRRLDMTPTCGQSVWRGGGKNAKTPPARTAFTANAARNMPRHVSCQIRRVRADRERRRPQHRRLHRWPCGSTPSRRGCS